MVSIRKHHGLGGEMAYVKLRLLAFFPLSIVLTLLNLLLYGGFQSFWPAGLVGPDLSFLSSILPAVGKVYAFHAACGFPDLGFFYASFVIFNLLGVVALDVLALRSLARVVPIYKTLKKPFTRYWPIPMWPVFGGLFLVMGLVGKDYISPHDCTGIGEPTLMTMVLRAMATAWLAMAIESGLRR